MPDKKEELEAVEETTEIQEAVDFDNSESRMSFLKSQLNDLLDGINDVYGQDLMEELLKRLEKTVEGFNVEVSGLIGKLKSGKIFDEDEPMASDSGSYRRASGDALGQLRRLSGHGDKRKNW